MRGKKKHRRRECNSHTFETYTRHIALHCSIGGRRERESELGIHKCTLEVQRIVHIHIHPCCCISSEPCRRLDCRRISLITYHDNEGAAAGQTLHAAPYFIQRACSMCKHSCAFDRQSMHAMLCERTCMLRVVAGAGVTIFRVRARERVHCTVVSLTECVRSLGRSQRRQRHQRLTKNGARPYGGEIIMYACDFRVECVRVSGA